MLAGESLIVDFETRNWVAVSHSLSLVMAGSFIALGMELSEYLVVSYTSSLTLSIAGVFKVSFLYTFHLPQFQKWKDR